MKKDQEPIVVEGSFNAPVDKVWRAITDVGEMREWYFDNIPSFVPEVGFQTQFVVRTPERSFLHRWKVTQVEPNKMISYDWSFEEYPGDSFVVFDLRQEAGLTLLRLTVHVREDFPDGIPELTRESCVAGWEFFINTRLTEYLQHGH